MKIRDASIVPPPVVLRGMLRVSDSLPRGISRASIARGGIGRLSTLRRPSAAAAGPGTGTAASPANKLVALDLATQIDRQVCLPVLFLVIVSHCNPVSNRMHCCRGTARQFV